ncbi:TetR/AcrR family transcriptional regulator [Sinorhizobium medicae]|uniref:TetR family transcriptional regulator n=1 Tax=Sinorhizobium medicae TaxID=110321 RepID=A0ABX4TSL7_9HYPH|nr:TetR/AcrR family transcriptional regulator [Sinorhizobium medicae]PLU09205.1 TetR family transcriptional regulator [Sinorhizobium medicae]PLU23789.1 TetR family transcriptional regulator [Sinorhizobium medicae]PLU80134.1 TetR family transcriptional regulator [Sinorhizobium medicae]
MPRVKKSPDVRTNELIDCAQRLFFEQGYENTTVNDVIREANVSKGAFYHYFVSKEALLEAVASRMAHQSLKELQALFEDPTLDAVGQLNALFAGSRRLKVEMAPQLKNTFNALFKPENIVLYHRIDAAVSAVTLPYLTGLLERGHKEGSLDAPDPEATALMLLDLRLGVAKTMHRALQQTEAGDLDGAARILDGWMRTYGLAVERLLKIPEGAIEITEPGFARAFLEATV